MKLLSGRCLVVFLILVMAATCLAQADSRRPERSRLRLFNTDVFGKSTTDPVVLLKPLEKGQLDPETVMVDVDKGRYYGATVNYPKKLTLAEARKSLNSLYAKYEKKSFANDPDMGLWRNDDAKFSIQLTEDDAHVCVIYIKFSMVSDEILQRAVSRAFKDVDTSE